jgi:ribonuclease E
MRMLDAPTPSAPRSTVSHTARFSRGLLLVPAVAACALALWLAPLLWHTPEPPAPGPVVARAGEAVVSASAAEAAQNADAAAARGNIDGRETPGVNDPRTVVEALLAAPSLQHSNPLAGTTATAADTPQSPVESLATPRTVAPAHDNAPRSAKRAPPARTAVAVKSTRSKAQRSSAAASRGRSVASAVRVNGPGPRPPSGHGQPAASPAPQPADAATAASVEADADLLGALMARLQPPSGPAAPDAAASAPARPRSTRKALPRGKAARKASPRPAPAATAGVVESEAVDPVQDARLMNR